MNELEQIKDGPAVVLSCLHSNVEVKKKCDQESFKFTAIQHSRNKKS
jgi:hypothetical protein